MKASVKEYLYLEKQIEENEDRLESYCFNKDIFRSQIFELTNIVQQAKKDIIKTSNYLILNNDRADKVRVNLIQTIENILEDIRGIRSTGLYPCLQQNLDLRGWIFFDILHRLQRVIENEGNFGASLSNLKESRTIWDSKGLEDILNKSIIVLSNSRFSNLKDSIDFFTEIAQELITEHKRMLETYYRHFNN